MTLQPAAPGTGIVFRRRDLGGVELAAQYRTVVESALCTTLANDAGVKVATIEHLMAAFAGLEIDNAIVELDGPEVPVMDGSAAPFVFLIECAGIVEQTAPRHQGAEADPRRCERQFGNPRPGRRLPPQLRDRFRLGRHPPARVELRFR